MSLVSFIDVLACGVGGDLESVVGGKVTPVFGVVEDGVDAFVRSSLVRVYVDYSGFFLRVGFSTDEAPETKAGPTPIYIGSAAPPASTRSLDSIRRGQGPSAV